MAKDTEFRIVDKVEPGPKFIIVTDQQNGGRVAVNPMMVSCWIERRVAGLSSSRVALALVNGGVLEAAESFDAVIALVGAIVLPKMDS